MWAQERSAPRAGAAPNKLEICTNRVPNFSDVAELAEELLVFVTLICLGVLCEGLTK